MVDQPIDPKTLTDLELGDLLAKQKDSANQDNFAKGCVKILPIVILFWTLVCLIVYAVSAQGETETFMTNCGNPEGLTVQPSGRVIEPR